MMTKTISMLALLTSTSAFADLPGDSGNNQPQPTVTKYCLESGRERDNSRTATCDATAENTRRRRPLKANGCANGQLALTIVGEANGIEACMGPGDSQL